MKKVRLPNRYGAFVYLERAGRRAFKLCGNFQYMSILGERDNIQAVDPDGGPFIAVGGKVAGMEVESIHDDGQNIYIFVKEKEYIKILFLDFDGVLTSDANTQKCVLEHRRENLFGIDWFDPDCVAALRKIVDETGAVVVISSSWRELGRDKLLYLWKELDMPGVLYGTTPEWVLTKKEAIEQWLSDNEHDAYAILDDDVLGLPNQVKTNPRKGLSLEDAVNTIDTLNRQSADSMNTEP